MTHLTDRQLALIRNRQGENIPVPPVRKKRDNVESRMQCAIIEWWRMQHKRFGVPEVLLFAVGNGGKRDAVTGAIMKREGVRAGTSDLILMVKRGPYGAMAIELKSPEGYCSHEQRIFLKEISNHGYLSRVCYSCESAMVAITEYLTNPTA